MSDDERLHAPSFESMDAGQTFGPPGTSIDPASVRGAPLSYRTVRLGGGTAAAPAATALPTRTQLAALAHSGAAARAPLRRVGSARFRDPGTPAPAQLQPPRWAIAPLDGGATAPTAPAVRTWSEHQAVLATLNRGKAAWQLLPAHELVA
jgi:hypothetical protein